jgi:hypothetical protein
MMGRTLKENNPAVKTRHQPKFRADGKAAVHVASLRQAEDFFSGVLEFKLSARELGAYY